MQQGKRSDISVSSLSGKSEVGGETLLLVDDEETLRELVRTLLENTGYKVFTAPDGEEALKLYMVSRADIALVITDLRMPRMGGDRLLLELKKINPAVKVVIISGHIDPLIRAALLGDGAMAILPKPVSIDDLLDTVRRGLTPK